MPPAFVHRITKYDPADRDEHGSYRGAENAVSDHGPVEAAYLEAISAFAEAAGIDRLEIREPSVTGLVHFGAQPAAEGHGLSGLFPADLTGYRPGADPRHASVSRAPGVGWRRETFLPCTSDGTST